MSCSAVIKQIKCNPKFPLIVAGASYTLLALMSAACLYMYFTHIASNDFWHWQLIGYVFMLANGITGFSEFFDQDSFFPLRDLLDYCQVVLVLPCYGAQMWLKTEMGPPELSAVHAGLGILAAVMFVTLECKRQDLTDLAMFANAVSLLCLGAISMNPLTILATLIMVAGYFIYKRDDEQCCMAPQDKFNFVMAAFAIIALFSFDDEIVQGIQDFVKNAINGEG